MLRNGNVYWLLSALEYILPTHLCCICIVLYNGGNISFSIFRNVHGAHKCLILDLLTTDRSSCRNFLRMDDESFKLLTVRVYSKITKMDTVMRESISATEHLSLTLRFLATGNVI